MVQVNPEREIANKAVLELFQTAEPVIAGIATARDVIPSMSDNLILHAGPPIAWENMCGPMRGAVLGALVYEGRAPDLAAAESLIESGAVYFDPCHDHAAVAPMAGVISPSMPVWVLYNRTHNTYAYSNLNEGPGATLRYGANNPSVIERLHWMKNILAPRLQMALAKAGEIAVFPLINEALAMGDECHSRNRAALSLFLQKLLPYFLSTDLSSSALKEIYDFLIGRDYFFLNITMAACKASWLKAESIAGASVITALSRNGVEFGIRLQGRWFTASSPVVNGHYFPPYTAENANRDIGDSAITEASGLGGFAAAGAPAVTGFIGGTPSELMAANLEMYQITAAESAQFKLEVLEKGSPTGIDVLKVVETGICPFVTTGIAHRLPGVGQVGAGRVRAPLECFQQASAFLSLSKIRTRD